MTANRVLEVDADLDLELFCAYLWQQGIRHRVFEEQGRQVLELADSDRVSHVREQFSAWRTGELTLRRTPGEAPLGHPQLPGGAVATMLQGALRYPALTGLVLIALACFPATWSMRHGVLSDFVGWLSFVDVTVINGRAQYANLETTLASGQLWRLITPIFLHFSIAHLLFNLAVTVEFGRRLEQARGAGWLIGVVLLIAVTSNLAQYAASGAGLFGGLSGVAYGLVGFVIVRSRMAPTNPLWQTNRSFAVAVVVFLILMSTGVTEVFGLHIANAAHWAGLGVGALLGLVSVERPPDDG